MNKRLRLRFAILVVLLVGAVAETEAFTATWLVMHKGQTFDLTYADKTLTARQGAKRIAGDKGKELGDFSEWSFSLGDDGFELIIDHKHKRTILEKHDLDAGGPFLLAVSPDSSLVAFDYGTGPAPRDLEVRDRSGKVLFKDTYLDQAAWTKGGLEYAFPTSVALDLNAETKKCAELGSAWKIEFFVFDGAKKRKLDRPETFGCSN